MVQNETKSVCRALYLRNHTSFDFWFLFMALMCKIISPGDFLIFSKFWFFGLLGRAAGRWKGKKWSKMRKNCLSRLISQELYIIWSSFVVNHNISRGFLYFFKTLIFSVVRTVKGQKMAHHDKKTYDLIWSWFMVHMCKRIVFYIFSKF